MKIVHIQSQYKGKEKLQLILFTAFCFAMLIVRMIYTNSFEYRFYGHQFVIGMDTLFAGFAYYQTQYQRA
jgi:hypothetical protein